jgi:hypothetical protein
MTKHPPEIRSCLAAAPAGILRAILGVLPAEAGFRAPRGRGHRHR